MSSYIRRQHTVAVAKADERLLAELGYKQEFQREFTPLEIFGVSFSIVGLLPSIASVLFYSIPNGGPVGMVWGWAVTSFFIVSIGMAMAELASAAPTSGGLYFWTHTYSSPKCRNLLAWIVGYANTIGLIASVASVDWGAAVQVMAAIGIGTNESFTPTDSKTFGVYVAIVLSHAVVCSLGTRILARLQNVYIALHVLLCFVIIVALPVTTPKELKNSASYALGNFTNLYDWPTGFAFILSFMAPVWTICSFDSAVHISEEASNAATAVPWAIVLSTAIPGILGFAVNIALAFCMGQDPDALMGSSLGQPMAQIIFNSSGKNGTLAIWSFIVLAQYMMGSSTMLVTSRQTFALYAFAFAVFRIVSLSSGSTLGFSARDGALPFSGWLYRMNRFTKTPVNTVWFCAAGSIALGALVFAGTQAINAVFAVSVSAQYIAYSIPIAARWIWRKENGWKPGTFSLGAWSGFCALVSVSWMVFMSIIFLFPTTAQTNAENMNYTIVLLGGVLVFSLVWYYFPVYGGVHWFKGPVPNVDGYVARTPRWAMPRDTEGVSETIKMEKGDAETEVVLSR